MDIYVVGWYFLAKGPYLDMKIAAREYERKGAVMKRDVIRCIKKIDVNMPDDAISGRQAVFSLQSLFRDGRYLTNQINWQASNAIYFSGRYAVLNTVQHTPPDRYI